MGIWDTISGTTDSLKRNGADLTTALKSWCPTTESLKRIAPDGTAVKNACFTAYGYGSAVRDNVIPYFPNEEVRSKIYQIAPILLKNATYEGLKFVPGGITFHDFAVGCYRDYFNSNKQEVDVIVKELQAKVLRLEKELGEFRGRNKPCADVKSSSISNVQSVATRKPEDVIRVFVMKEFMWRQLTDDLMVPVAPRKRVVTSTGVDKMEE